MALGLKEAVAVLESRLQATADRELPYADFLADPLDTELSVRRERYLKTRIAVAHFPFGKTLDTFDFSFQPSIDERQIRELAHLTFAHTATNVLFLGPPGIGNYAKPGVMERSGAQGANSLGAVPTGLT